MSDRRLRSLWLNVHLWLGLGLLVVLIPLGLSGSVLVWREGVDRMLNPHRYAASASPAAQPLSAYVAAAQGAFGPDVRPSQVRLPRKQGDPVVVMGLSAPAPGARPAMLNAWLDPADGHALGAAPVMEGLIKLSHDVHGHLLIPGLGRSLVGWLGVALTLSCVTGLILWWPHGGFLGGLRWRRSGSTNINLHYAVGFWIALPLAVVSLTGVGIAFPPVARALMGVKAPAAGPARPGGPGGRFAPPLASTILTPDQAAARAIDAAPGARVALIAMPTPASKPAWRVELATGGRPMTVRVIDASGAVEIQPASGPPGGGGDPAARLMRSLHEGADTYVWQLIVFLTGLAPTALGGTGLIMWLRKEGAKRRRRLA